MKGRWILPYHTIVVKVREAGTLNWLSGVKVRLYPKFEKKYSTDINGDADCTFTQTIIVLLDKDGYKPGVYDGPWPVAYNFGFSTITLLMERVAAIQPPPGPPPGGATLRISITSFEVGATSVSVSGTVVTANMPNGFTLIGQAFIQQIPGGIVSFGNMAITGTNPGVFTRLLAKPGSGNYYFTVTAKALDAHGVITGGVDAKAFSVP